MTEYTVHSHTTYWVTIKDHWGNNSFRESFTQSLFGLIFYDEGEQKRMDFLMEHGKRMSVTTIESSLVYAVNVILDEPQAIEYRLRFSRKATKI